MRFSQTSLPQARVRASRRIRSQRPFRNGVSAWGLKLERAKQQNLIIRGWYENDSEITADNLRVAQFIYLMLNN
jgi:hypothetical protein